MFALLFSILYWSFLIIFAVLLFPVAFIIWLLTFPFDRRGRLLHLFTSFWAALYTWINPFWRVIIEGRQNIRPDIAYVIISNHQSLIDIFILFRLFAHYKWVSKIENFRVPFIGWNMRLNRYIELRRGSMKSNVQMMRECEKTLASGSSILIFPEGTRSERGKMRSFKEGAFGLAIKTRKPILPLILDGSARALPKKGIILRGKHVIRVRVLKEIPPESFDGKETDELLKEIQSMMATELLKLQKK